jgi:hypothetical protein
MPDWLLSLLAGGAGGFAAAFLAKTWIEARVTASIKHEYDQVSPSFKGDLSGFPPIIWDVAV